jgi:hypothetical protein
MSRLALLGLTVLSLSGCATMTQPAPEKLASLPVVEFPAAPATDEYILKIPAGKPIPTRVVIEGSALTRGADQSLDVTLPRDLYLYRQWVSDDGKSWRAGQDEMEIRVTVLLPSHERPEPGEIRVKVDRKNPAR